MDENSTEAGMNIDHGNTPFSVWTNVIYAITGVVLIVAGVAGQVNVAWSFWIGHAIIFMGAASAYYHSRYSKSSQLNDRQGMYLTFSIMLFASVYAWGGKDSLLLEVMGLAMGWVFVFFTTRLDRLDSTAVLVPLVLIQLLFTGAVAGTTTALWLLGGYLSAVVLRELVDPRLWVILNRGMPVQFRHNYDAWHGAWHIASGMVILSNALVLLGAMP